MYNHLVTVKEGELSGTKSNPLFYPNKSCNASVLGANYMDLNVIIVAFMKVMCVFSNVSVCSCHPCVRQSEEDSRTHSVCWPRDWLTQDCRHLRIIGMNYDTNLSMWAPMCPVERVK